MLAVLAGCSGSATGQNGDEAVEGRGASTMILAPDVGFAASGCVGGPFLSASQSVTLSNAGQRAHSYSRSISVPWLEASGLATGIIRPFEELRFDLALNAAANDLSEGTHSGVVAFSDLEDTVVGSLECTVEIAPDNGLRVAVERSTFTAAPHHAHFSAKDTELDSGGLEDARISWVARRAGGEMVDSRVGGPEFGVVFEEPGDYVVTLRVQGEGDTTWLERQVPITVDEPSYRAECWLDPSAPSNGSGTISSPFNDWASAIRHINAHWVDSAANEHCIHIRRGTSATTKTSWDPGESARVGRLVYKPYGTGERPRIDHSGGPWVTTRGSNAFAAIDLEVTGDDTPGTFVFVSHVTAGAGTNGFNVCLLRCGIRDCASGLYFNDLGEGSATHVAKGEFDFIAVKDSTFEGIQQIQTLAPRSRYVLFQGNEWGAVQTQFGQRFNHIQHADFRGNVHERAVGTASIFRIHSNLVGADTQWISIADCTFHDETWIGADAGASHDPYPMRHIWIERCRVDGSGRTWALAAFANERLVIRNCWARGRGSCINHRTNSASGTATNWIIEGNSMVGEQTSGTLGRGWQTTTTALTDVTFRNNLLHMPNLTGAAYFFSVGGEQDPNEVFAECDGNQFSAAGGTRRWAAGFTVSGESLAEWRAGTGHSARSSDEAEADFQDPTGIPFDLCIGPESTAIDAAIPAHGLEVDIFTNTRVGSGDVGAHDRDGIPR